ncbi:hypothetical protein Efla_007871 [Eimeria flavescens]
MQDYDFLVATAADGGGSSQPSEESIVLAAVAAAVRSPDAAKQASAKSPAAATSPAAGAGGKEEAAGCEGAAAVSAGGEADKEQQQPQPNEEEQQQQQRRQQNAERRRAYRERMKKRRQEGLFVRPKKNTSIYVSGLPPHFTETDVAELFKKAGVFKVDADTLQPKIRLYVDEAGRPKGDGLVAFVHEASVDTAIKYFNDYAVSDSHTIKVVRADFSKKQGEAKALAASLSASGGPPANQQAARLRQRKRMLAARQEQQRHLLFEFCFLLLLVCRLLSWGLEVADGRAKQRIVVLRPMYSTAEAEKHEEGDAFYEELRDEVRDEVAKIAMPEKVTVIPRHPQGIVCLKFQKAEEAQLVVERMQGRLFDGRQVEASFFDGATDFRASCIPSNKKRELSGGKAASPGSPSGEAAAETEEKNLEKFGVRRSRV